MAALSDTQLASYMAPLTETQADIDASILHCTSRPSLDRIFQCSNAALRSLIINHPEWIDVNAIYRPYLSVVSPWYSHHLLSYAVLQCDIERIQILTQHPYIKLDVNQLDLRKCTALVWAVDIWRIQPTSWAQVSKTKKGDDITMRLISLLASLGADPNIGVSVSFNSPALDYVFLSRSPTVAQHFITTFHPMNRGVTCIIPLDLTLIHTIRRKKRIQSGTIFQRLQLFSDKLKPPKPQQFAQLIISINQQFITPFAIFTMATHPRVGHSSAVYRVFRTSPMYDLHLLRLIWRFVCSSETLPSSQEEIEEMIHACQEKQAGLG